MNMNMKILFLIAGLFLVIHSVSALWYNLEDLIILVVGVLLLKVAINEFKIKT